MRFLVTGGPTHEYLDRVRYFGNSSSGAMGIALAQAASDRGHLVTLVLGPSALPDPAGVRVSRVVSALEMREAVLAALPEADAVVMAAAVADYRPRDRFPGKIKKGAQDLVVSLVKNPDILGEVGTMPGARVLVGFALEAAGPAEALAYGREKLRLKNCDLVVLNRPGSLGSTAGEDVVLLPREGAEVVLGAIDKRELAGRVVRWCEERYEARAGTPRTAAEQGHAGGQGSNDPSSDGEAPGSDPAPPRA